MNCANECTTLDCRFPQTQEWAATTKAWRECAREGYSTFQSALYTAAELRCSWCLSLGQLMAHCKEYVPRRKRTEIKWTAGLPSLVWLVVLSRCLTLRGTLGLVSVSISQMTQSNDTHFWHLGRHFPCSYRLLSTPHHRPGYLPSWSWQEVCLVSWHDRKPAIRWSVS